MNYINYDRSLLIKTFYKKVEMKLTAMYNLVFKLHGMLNHTYSKLLRIASQLANNQNLCGKNLVKYVTYDLLYIYTSILNRNELK